MATQILACPNCGKTVFDIPPESNRENLSAVCGNCGHTVSDKLVKKWLFEIAVKSGKKAFKRFK